MGIKNHTVISLRKVFRLRATSASRTILNTQFFVRTHNMYYICTENYDEEHWWGIKSPFFVRKMEQKKVFNLLNEALQENTNLFLISATISLDNKIKVVVDGDEGVPLSECVRISRKIEHNLDREVDDFSLEVTTAGASEPLTMKRQYYKNMGRTLSVKLNDGTKIEGALTTVNEESIMLSWKAREPKPIGKGKVTVEKEASIIFDDIKEAKVKIKFN